MPGKGRKVAARQAQVGRRRRRQTREGGTSSSGSISGVMVSENNGDTSSVSTDTEPNVINDHGSTRNTVGNRGFRSVGIRDDQMSSNRLIKSECLRISIMAGALTSVLVILAVVI